MLYIMLSTDQLNSRKNGFIMRNFDYWYNEIADIPLQDKNGDWYDAETGFTYSDWTKDKNSYVDESTKAENRQAIEKAKVSRKAAKEMGAKALKGTAKQKAWAEEIRKNILLKVNSEAANLLIKCESATGHSTFWIENRDKNAYEFEVFILKIVDLIRQLNKLHSESKTDSDEYKEIMLQVNDLKKVWKID